MAVYTSTEIVTNIVNACDAIVQAQSTAAGLSLTTRLNNVVQGVLEVFDGLYPDVPIFIVAPNPDPEYVADSAAAGADVYPVGVLEYGTDVGGLMSAAWVESL